MSDDQLKLIEDVTSEVIARVESVGFENLSEPEQVVLLPWWSKGIIDNGGFQYFYEGASNMTNVAFAFDTLGFPDAAEACRSSMSIFPNSIPPEDHQERRRFMDAHSAETKALWNRLDHSIWNISEQALNSALVAYIRQHNQAFRNYAAIKGTQE